MRVLKKILQRQGNQNGISCKKCLGDALYCPSNILLNLKLHNENKYTDSIINLQNGFESMENILLKLSCNKH